VAVAGIEKRALVERRKAERGPGNEVLEIEVAAEGPRGLGAHALQPGRRGDRDDAHEWRERHFDSRSDDTSRVPATPFMPP
jgi:hypothetical protein